MESRQKIQPTILSFLFTFIFFASAYAQTGTIKGIILTSDGKPAEFVNVMVKEIKKGTVTNEKGEFTFNNIKEGTYTISTAFVGLLSIEKQVTVTSNQNTELNFTLAENAQELSEVVITSRKSLNQKDVTIGKMPVKIMDLPQSVAVIDESTIKNQQAQRLSDVVKNVNGVYLASTRGSTQENFSARGYGFSSSNMFKDGSRINTGTMPEMSSLEKVEILKGSAAILYGNVSAGGIINMVTKQPKFMRGGEVSMRVGSYNLYKPAFDIYGPISKKIAYRINGTYENAKSYRDVPASTRYYVNPSLLFRFSDKTEFVLQVDYLKHDFTPDFGIGSYDNTKIPDVPRGTFYGTPWQYAKTHQISSTATVKHIFNDKWQMNSSVAYQQYGRDYYSTERIQALANGDWARPLNKQKTFEEYYTAQFNLVGKIKTFGFDHTLLAGVDADRYNTQNYFYNNPKIYDTINLFNFTNEVNPRTDIPATIETYLTTLPTNRIGAYVQDLISINAKIKVLAGVRYSYQNVLPVDTFTYKTGKNTGPKVNKVDQAFSPRFGVVYKPVANTALFASYANSFSVNTGTDILGNALAPSIIDQYEIGIKNDFFKNMVSANLTFYKIINNNLAQMAQFTADGSQNSNGNLKELSGQTTSDGVELDVNIRPIKGFELLAGYSYNHIRYTKTSEVTGSFIKGERLINNPGSTANVSVFYTFSKSAIKGLKIGASVFYTGTRYAGFNNRVGQAQTIPRNFEVDAFTTIDFNAGYSFKKFSIMAKASNITNTLNYNVHENYSVNPIAPRMFFATLAYKL